MVWVGVRVWAVFRGLHWRRVHGLVVVCGRRFNYSVCFLNFIVCRVLCYVVGFSFFCVVAGSVVALWFSRVRRRLRLEPHCPSTMVAEGHFFMIQDFISGTFSAVR